MLVPSNFRPAWWLPGPHLQTLWPFLIRPRQEPTLHRERLELPDKDFLDLDWTAHTDGPLVVIFHGLEGSSRSHYITRLLHMTYRHGMQAVIIHFRGCSGEPNRLARGYHAGVTEDIAYTVDRLRANQPNRPLAAIGYSLGGNALLKWLGEIGSQSPLFCAIAVSVPFNLALAAERLSRGASRVYQRYLLGKLRRSLARKTGYHGLPYTKVQLTGLRTMREFDHRITAPLHGYRDADDYYERASASPYLAKIKTPTLIIHARDDPFVDPRAIPQAVQLSDQTTLELADSGGHVGFVAGSNPIWPRYWLNTRILDWLRANGF